MSTTCLLSVLLLRPRLSSAIITTSNTTRTLNEKPINKDVCKNLQRHSVFQLAAYLPTPPPGTALTRGRPRFQDSTMKMKGLVAVDFLRNRPSPEQEPGKLSGTDGFERTLDSAVTVGRRFSSIRACFPQYLLVRSRLPAQTHLQFSARRQRWSRGAVRHSGDVWSGWSILGPHPASVKDSAEAFVRRGQRSTLASVRAIGLRSR